MAKGKDKGGRPRKHGPAPRPARSGKRLTADIDPVIMATLDAYREARWQSERLRLTQTQILEMALIQMFERSGHWPPPAR